MPIGGNGPTQVRQRAPIGRAPAQAQAGGARQGGIMGAQRPQQGQGGRPAQQQQPAREAGGITGYDAIRAQNQRQTEIEQRRAQQRADGYTPHRFYLPDPTKPGITREELEANIVILDDAPTFAAHEHALPNPQTGRFGKGGEQVLCLSNEGHCPACDADQNDPYFALFLTIQDMRGYVNQQGVHVPHSRKLLVVKNKNQDYFFRQYERRGTLRGMQLLMVRNDKRGANHGNPEFVDLHSEELILETFQHGQVMSQDGQRVVKEANEDCYAYDYAKVFPKPNYEEMLERFGGNAAAGSSVDQAQTWGRDAGQFGQARSGGTIMGRAGGVRAGIQSRTAGQMGAHASENDYDDGEGSAEDSPTQQGGGMTRGISTASRTQVAQDMDDDIPFRQAPASSNTASRGNVGAVTDPADIPL